MSSISWGLDSIIAYPACDHHSFRYIFMNYLSSDYNYNPFSFLFGPHSLVTQYPLLGGCVEEHCSVWLSVNLHRHGTHFIPTCILIWKSLHWGDFIVLEVLRTIHWSPQWPCSLKVQEANEACNILGCLDCANALWVSSIHGMGPHRRANTVAGGVGAHGRLVHWAGISHVWVVSMSHGLLSFSITVLAVFCLQFSVTYLPWYIIMHYIVFV